MAKPKDYKLKAVAGTSLQVIATWTMDHPGWYEGYKVRWDCHYKKTGWVKGSESTVKVRQATFTAPNNAKLTAVRCCILPVSKSWKEDQPTGETNKDGTPKTRSVTVYSDPACERLTPPGGLPSNVKKTITEPARKAAAQQAEKQKAATTKATEKVKAVAAWRSAQSNEVKARYALSGQWRYKEQTSSAAKARAWDSQGASFGYSVVNINQTCYYLYDKYPDKASAARAASALYSSAARDYSSSAVHYGKAGADGLKSSAEKKSKECSDAAAGAAAAADKLVADNAAAAARKRQRDLYLARAVSQRQQGDADVSRAANHRRGKAYAKAAYHEESAAWHYGQAVTELGRAKSYKSSDADGYALDDRAAAIGTLKSRCDERRRSDEAAQEAAAALAAEMAAAPAAPTDVRASRSGTGFTASCKVAAKWAAYVAFEVYDSASGKWRAWKGSTVSRRTGGASASTASCRLSGARGRTYRFRARSLLANKSTASAWAYSETYRTAPAAPSGLRASVAAGSVTLDWRNEGGARESVEVQYSTYRNAKTGKTAWADGATAEIKTVKLGANAERCTLTGLEGGARVYARVRAVNSSGSAWATAKGNAKSTTVSAVPPRAAVKLAALTGLKAVLLADKRTVKLTWSGAVEDGASVTVEHTAKAGAFGNNVADAIESEAYEPASAAAKSHALSISTLDQGKTHWFRVTKAKGGAAAVRARCASGEWRSSDYVAKVAVPAQQLPGVAAPTALSLSSPYEGAVRAEWSDKCKSGESYEIQHTANAQAFADNAAGDITSTAYGEPAVGAGRHVFTLTGLEPGTSYWVRVRKKDGDGASAWSGVAEITLAPPSSSDEGLQAPAASQTSMAYAASERPVLSWVHSAEQESAQSAYELLLSASPPGPAARYEAASDEEVDPAKTYYAADGDGYAEVEEPTDGGLGGYYVLVEDPAGTPVETTLAGGADNAAELDLSGYADGTRVTWMVRTQGAVEGVWSPWSAAQSFDVVEPPVAGVALSGPGGGAVGGDAPLSALPLAVSVQLGGMSSNPPVELHVEVVAAEGHETVAADGSDAFVAAGEAVFSRYYTAEDGLAAGAFEVEVGARDARLDDGQAYVVRASASTSLGLRAEAQEASFEARLGGGLPAPVASASLDAEALTVSVAAACYAAEGGEGGEGGDEADAEQVAASLPVDPSSLPLSVELPAGAVGVLDVSATVPDGGGGASEVPVEWSWGDSTRTLVVESVASGGAAAELSYTYAVLAGDAGAEEPEGAGDGEDGPRPAPGLTAEQAQLLAEVGESEPEAVEPDLPDYSDELALAGDGGGAGEGATLLDGVTLDVYRVSFDGTAVPLASGLPNDGGASCADPHPPFGTATYRVVARDAATGAQSASEVSADVPASRVVLTTPWGDVAMPYGLTVEEDHGSDAEAVAFSGRRKKVAFFGETVETSVRQTAAVLARLGGGEVAALRRLAHARTLAYLRDPSGLAFWAIVRVRMGHPNPEVTEVSLEYEMVDAPEGEVD